jgi:hypothetical protein
MAGPAAVWYNPAAAAAGLLSGPTIIEADATIVGVAASSLVGAALWNSATSTDGLGSVSFDGEDASGPTIVEADGLSVGSAALSVIGAALWNTNAVSVGIGAQAAAGASIFNGVVNTAGIAVYEALASSTALAVLASSGVASVDFPGENAAAEEPTAIVVYMPTFRSRRGR